VTGRRAGALLFEAVIVAGVLMPSVKSIDRRHENLCLRAAALVGGK
jgi:hypothetical protein